MNEVQIGKADGVASAEDRERHIARVTEMMRTHAEDKDAIGIIVILPKRIVEDGQEGVSYTLFTTNAMIPTLNIIAGVYEAERDNVQQLRNADLTSTH